MLARCCCAIAIQYHQLASYFMWPPAGAVDSPTGNHYCVGDVQPTWQNYTYQIA